MKEKIKNFLVFVVSEWFGLLCLGLIIWAIYHALSR